MEWQTKSKGFHQLSGWFAQPAHSLKAVWPLRSGTRLLARKRIRWGNVAHKGRLFFFICSDICLFQVVNHVLAYYSIWKWNEKWCSYSALLALWKDQYRHYWGLYATLWQHRAIHHREISPLCLERQAGLLTWCSLQPQGGISIYQQNISFLGGGRGVRYWR